MTKLLVSGIGITSAIGQGRDEFLKKLLAGNDNLAIMKREGRQKDSEFIGSEIDKLNYSKLLSQVCLKTASWSTKVAMLTLEEAWHDSNLSQIPPERIGLILGGSNLQQREQMLLQQRYQNSPYYINPKYGFTFLDSDISAYCCEHFGINGLHYNVGGASSSGQLAIIESAKAVQSGIVDVCISLAGLMDLSYFELYALQNLGAMATGKLSDKNALNCPFDKAHKGFVYGENCAAIVIESKKHALDRNASCYGEIASWSSHVDGNRNPNPSLAGEQRVITQSLAMAGLKAKDIDYINPHGTGAPLGDETEIKALKSCGLTKAFINTTKSITGHGLSAAGGVEVVATLLQMQSNKLHPCLNLNEPIDNEMNWVGKQEIKHKMNHALSLSYGFGGFNTAICLSKV
jgi:malonyl-ACP decarboxylase